MTIENYGDIDLRELDVFKEISSIGTSHAASSLSKLLSREVRISLPDIEVLGCNAATGKISAGNPEKVVAATLVRMSGDINGLMLFLFDLEFANMILSEVMKKEYKSFEEMDKMAESALNEIGNIIICSYVNSLSKLANLDIKLSIPYFTMNMIGAILTVPMTAYGYETDDLMYSNADFIMDGRKTRDWLLMLPDIDSLNYILQRLGVA